MTQPRSTEPINTARILAVLATLATAACATAPPPTEQMAVTRAAVADADSAEAGSYAAVELHNAHQRLDAANVAMGARDYNNARRYAEEAEADANLAATQARSAKAQRAVAEVKESLRVLREEMVRNGQ
jgi:outer membrane PBP1 activator LpoA protein